MAEIASSEELRAFLLRLYAAMGDNDADAVREMFSSSACLLNIGTDSDEWWTGPEETEVLLRQNGQLVGIELRPGAPVAYCVGNVGWIADRPRLVLRTGTEVGLRLTLVLAIERGHWRIVQWHGSIGEKDESAFGRSLIKSIDHVARSVREGIANPTPLSRRRGQGNRSRPARTDGKLE